MARFTHQLKQLRFVVLGGVGTYWTNTARELARIVLAPPRSGIPFWTSIASAFTVFVFLIVVCQFLWLILMPHLRNVSWDYANWRASPELRNAINFLTMTLVFGWSVFVYTLASGTALGVGKSIIGATSFYMTAIGLLGLIPVPRRIPA